jgi:large subunit ribosomal protein L19
MNISRAKVKGPTMKAKKFTKETIAQLAVYERNFPAFEIGDCVGVSQRIKEGDKERLQVFEGDVIAMHKNGASSTFIVRKIAANNVAVERIFPYYSPLIDSITLVRKADVRRAKLYYLRDRVGKAARVKEKVQTKAEKAL